MKINELNIFLNSLFKNIRNLNQTKLCLFIEKLCKLENSALENLDSSLLQKISNQLLSKRDTEQVGLYLSNRLETLNQRADITLDEIENELDIFIKNDEFNIENNANKCFNIQLEEIKLERLKIFAKIITVLITVIIGTVGVALINSSVQKSKINLQKEKDKAEIQKTEMEYLGNLLKHALTDDDQKRLLFSEYYAALTVSEDLRTNWQKYHTKIKEDVETYEQLKKEYDIAREKGLIKEVERLSFEIKGIQKGLRPFLGQKISLLKARKIVHLSDFGIRQNSDNRKEKIKCIIDNLIHEAKPSSEYLVIITGDLVANPSESNFLYVKEQLNRLESNGYIVLLVAGNHDYARMGNFYDSNYRELFKKYILDEKKFDFPKLDIIDNIAFIGLDTMEGRTAGTSFEFATGSLGLQQLKRLDSLLLSDDVVATNYRVLYMHHSPFLTGPFFELKDSKELKQVLQKHSNIDAMLFGSSHKFSHYFDIWDIKRSYDAGSSTADNVNTRIIDLTKEPEYDSILDLGCKNIINHK